MFSYLFGISRRWEMMFLLMSGVLVVYTLRVNISVAANKMTEDLGWSEKEKGLEKYVVRVAKILIRPLKIRLLNPHIVSTTR